MMQQHQAQMQREQSDMEMNGHRPQSPSSAENAPSPSKRPRLDGSQPNGQQMTPNGRGQGQAMPGQPNPQTSAMLMQHGINPRTLTQQQFQALQAQNPAAQAKAVQVYNASFGPNHHDARSTMNHQGIPNGMMNPGVMPNQEMMPMPDGQDMLQMQEYYGANAQLRPGPQTPGGNGQGNHALHDYQMQLMILESQNKKRLLLARQEQPQGANGEGGQQAMPPRAALPPGTSPQESRTGGSPNPNDQMKRGTPKLPQNGIPGSPSVGDAAMAQNRSSPASMNFAGQMPPEMGGAAFLNMKGMPEGVVAPNGMRPPSSNPAFSGPQVPQQMEAMARAQQGQAQAQGQGPGAPNRMPSGGNWQQQQPQQQPPQQGVPPQGQQQQAGGPSQQQQQPAGTPQERNAMPPPQAPPASAAGANATGRTQTSSPQPGGAAPPTPQQPSKPAPKKNEGKEKARKVSRTTSLYPCTASSWTDILV